MRAFGRWGAEPQDFPCFPTPFCSTRPMPRFPVWEFPSPAPLPPHRHPTTSSQSSGASHSTPFLVQEGESQALDGLSPGHPNLGTPQPLPAPLDPLTPLGDASWLVGPGPAPPSWQSWDKARIQVTFPGHSASFWSRSYLLLSTAHQACGGSGQQQARCFV